VKKEAGTSQKENSGISFEKNSGCFVRNISERYLTKRKEARQSLGPDCVLFISLRRVTFCKIFVNKRL
jgi:hypothetical protein